MCEKQEAKNYLVRKSPPYPANACQNEERIGNDGLCTKILKKVCY